MFSLLLRHALHNSGNNFPLEMVLLGYIYNAGEVSYGNKDYKKATEILWAIPDIPVNFSFHGVGFILNEFPARTG